MGSTLKAIEMIRSRFDEEATSDVSAVFLFQVDDNESCFASIKNGTCDIKIGEHDNPDVTLAMDSDTLQKIMSGEIDGMQAFMTGVLRIEGDMELALKFNEYFPEKK